MSPQRKNSAPEYLFDRESRILILSSLFQEKDEETTEKTGSETGIDLSATNKKLSFDTPSNKNTIHSEEEVDEFVLNNYKKGEELRNRYMSQLINKGIWEPNAEKKQFNSIIIFDWDDTLLPTSFLESKHIFTSFNQLSNNETQKITKIEELLHELLSKSIEKGDVYIITNADSGWVEYSCSIIYPTLVNLLNKIKIISAKKEYQEKFPGNLLVWKIKTFLNLTDDLDVKRITNIICFGDSTFEMEAGKILASKFSKACIKIVKFKEKPELDEIYKQIQLVNLKFNIIYSSVKNLTIRVEKKKKE